jgi:RNA polymerase sigma-70 factor (ECF subfamily)
MSGFAGKTLSDDLLARARRGEPAAQEAIYRLFSSPVYSLAARMTGSRTAAEDVLQDSFIEVFRGLRDFRGDAALATWIRRIAVSRSLMYLRTAWQRRATLFRDLVNDEQADLEIPDSRQSDPAAGMDLEQALARLPDVSRVVVLLHDVEGYTHAEIGELMGMSASFSKSQLSRAHRRLRSMLADSDSQARKQDAGSA